ASDGEISEWAIVAAAFGEAETAPEPAPTPEPVAAATHAVEEAPKSEEPSPAVADAAAGEVEAGEEAKVEEVKAEEPKVEEPRAGIPRPSAVGAEWPAVQFLGQAAFRARARGTARAAAPAGARAPRPTPSRAARAAQRAAILCRHPAARGAAPRWTEGWTTARRPAARTDEGWPPRGASWVTSTTAQCRRPGTAPLRHHRKEGRCGG